MPPFLFSEYCLILEKKKLYHVHSLNSGKFESHGGILFKGVYVTVDKENKKTVDVAGLMASEKTPQEKEVDLLKAIDTIWRCIYAGEKSIIDFEKVLQHKNIILEILKIVLSSGNEVLIENISALVLVLAMETGEEIERFKEEILFLYRRYQDDNRLVKESLQILNSLY